MLSTLWPWDTSDGSPSPITHNPIKTLFTGAFENPLPWNEAWRLKHDDSSLCFALDALSRPSTSLSSENVELNGSCACCEICYWINVALLAAFAMKYFVLMFLGSFSFFKLNSLFIWWNGSQDKPKHRSIINFPVNVVSLFCWNCLQKFSGREQNLTFTLESVVVFWFWFFFIYLFFLLNVDACKWLTEPLKTPFHILSLSVSSQHKPVHLNI